MFGGFSEITPDFLSSIGVSALLCDIDNTLVTYDDPEPTEALLEWITKIKEAGISIAFVSNNHKERVELFNSSLGFPAFYDSKKPISKNAKKALLALGKGKSATAMLGDQIFTDVWTGRALGITTLLVPPIKDKTNIFFRSKRLLEKPFIALYKIYGERNKKK